MFQGGVEIIKDFPVLGVGRTLGNAGVGQIRQHDDRDGLGQCRHGVVGAREHALVRALLADSEVDAVVVALKSRTNHAEEAVAWIESPACAGEGAQTRSERPAGGTCPARAGRRKPRSGC